MLPAALLKTTHILTKLSMGIKIAKRPTSISFSDADLASLNSMAVKRGKNKSAIISDALKLYVYISARRERGEELKWGEAKKDCSIPTLII